MTADDVISLLQNHFTRFGFGPERELLSVMPLHYISAYVKTVPELMAHCCFHVNAPLHLREQGSREVKRITNFGLDGSISLSTFYSNLSS